jgi:hypothetical protein
LKARVFTKIDSAAARRPLRDATEIRHPSFNDAKVHAPFDAIRLGHRFGLQR